MTFKEFSHALQQDERAMELLNRADHTAEQPLTNEELKELIERSNKIKERE